MLKDYEDGIISVGSHLWFYIPDSMGRAVMQKFQVDGEAALDTICQRFLKDPQLTSDFMLCTPDEIPDEVEGYTETNPCCIVVPGEFVLGMTVGSESDDTEPTDEWVEALQGYNERLSHALYVAALSLLRYYEILELPSEGNMTVDEVMESVDDPMRVLTGFFAGPMSFHGDDDTLSSLSDEWRQVQTQGDEQAVEDLLRKVLLHLQNNGSAEGEE